MYNVYVMVCIIILYLDNKSLFSVLKISKLHVAQNSCAGHILGLVIYIFDCVQSRKKLLPYDFILLFFIIEFHILN